MREPVKRQSRRTRREIASAATREVIVEAAKRLFLERGYVGAAVEEIAQAAGVAVQTVYNSIGAKREVLAAVLDHVAAGAEAPTPIPVFMRERTARSRTGVGVVRVLADWFTEAHARTGGMLMVLRAAAAIDPSIADLERVRDKRRYQHYHEAARAIEERAGLPRGLTLEDAAAVIWSLGNPEIYRFLVLEEGWPLGRYRRWLERGLGAQLLAPMTQHSRVTPNQPRQA